MSFGAAVRVKVSESIIVVLSVDSLLTSEASAKFSYKVVGKKYKWYEKPFIELNIWYYYFFMVSGALALFIVIFCPICWGLTWACVFNTVFFAGYSIIYLKLAGLCEK